MSKRRLCFLYSCLLIFLLTGCWDDTDIEKRGFIVGAAIDLADGEKDGKPRVTWTDQYVVALGMGNPASGGGGNQPAYMNASGSGAGTLISAKEIRTSTNLIPLFQQLKVVVISEDILTTPHLFSSMMDLHFRNTEIPKSAKILVSKGEAKEILNIIPENAKIPALYLDTLLDKNLKKKGEIKTVQLIDLHEALLTNKSFTLPVYSPGEKKVDYMGGVAFHGYEGISVGMLDQEEMIGLNLVIGAYQKGPLQFNHEGNLITFDVNKANRKLIIDTKDKEKLSISVEVNVEGGIAEIIGTEEITDAKTIVEFEEEIEKIIEELAGEIIERAQNELGADIFGVNERLKQRHYRTWEHIKDDWDHGENYFKKATFNVKAKARIRTVGDSRKSYKKVKD